MTEIPGEFSNPYGNEEGESDQGFLGGLGDIAISPLRGAESAVAGVANLFGAGLEGNELLGESENPFAGFMEGLAQFLTGFIPGAGLLSKFGGGLSKYAQVAAKAKGAAKTARSIGVARNIAAGAISDFAVFDSNDPRLANLLQSVPGLESGLMDYLASDPNSDPGDLGERMKNVIEGAGLGLITDGLMAIFKGIRKYNQAVNDGDVPGAVKAEKEVAAAAEDTFDRPVDGPDAEAEDLLEPETFEARRPEEEGYTPLEDPDPIDGPPDAERITMGMAEERLPYRDDGDIVVVAKPGDAYENPLRGFTQFDSFVREPDSRLQIIQLKRGANILRGRSAEATAMMGRKPRGISKADHERNLIEAAKINGYDAVSFGRGHNVETVILKEDAVLQRINVESKKPFFEHRQQAQSVKIQEIVNNSRVEAAVHNMNLTPDTAEEFAYAWKRAVDDPAEDHMEKIAGIVNLEKMGERGQRAFYKVFAEEFDHHALRDKSISWEETTQGAAKELAQMTGADPFVVAKQFDRKADDVIRAGNMAVASRKYFQIHMKKMITLAEQIIDWDKGIPVSITDRLGNALDRNGAAEMLHRNLESMQALGRSVSRLRSASGRLLNTFKIGVDQMSRNELMRSLELRGGDVNHVLKTAKQILEDATIGGLNHASAQIVARSKRGRFMSAITDFYMFSLLSAPKTLTTNIAGSAATMVYRPMESALGAWVGKKLLGKERAAAMERAISVNLRSVTIMRTMMSEAIGIRKGLGQDTEVALRAAKRTLDTGEGTLVPQSAWKDNDLKSVEGLSLDNVNEITGGELRGDEGFGKALELIFKGTRMPSRFMGASDEFIKQIAYHAHIRAELIEQANEAGLTRLQGPGIPTIDEWVNNEMRKMTLNGQAKTEKALRAQAEQRYTRIKFADEANRQEHIRDYVDRELADPDVRDGSQVKHRSALMTEALRIAREVTFTTQLSPDRGIISKGGHLLQQFVESHPSLRFFVPFIRTPLNLLMFSADRLPVPGLNKDFVPMLQYLGSKAGILPKRLEGATNRFVQQISSSNPQVAAEAFGRATTAMGVLSVVGGAAFSGHLTGGGPSDLEHRKILQATGWQPYSLKVGDTFISYQRLDPFATALAMAADAADVTRFGADDQEIEEVAIGMLAATIENLSSKSYLAGVMDLMKLVSDPQNQAPKTAGRLAGSIIPNVFAAQRSFTDEHFDEVAGILDRIKSRIPFLSEDVNLQRNALGEPVNKKTFGSVMKKVGGISEYISPFQFNTIGDDMVDNELSDLAFPFRPASYRKFGVDLRDYKLDSGQTAYDRWQQLTSEVSIGNRKLRPALRRLINSRQYQRLDKLPVDQLDIDSPRVQLINQLVNKYRRRAEREMMKEFLELREHTLDQRQARQSLLSGNTSSQDISSLLGGR